MLSIRPFRWLKRRTRHFGEVSVPIAELDLRAGSSKWHTFAVLVDTGAVVSLLRRSAADVLGVNWAAGTVVALTSVGTGGASGRLHDLHARIDGYEFSLPVVFAEGENVPNLLGRKGLLDRLAVDFDPGPQHTVFRSPGFDAEMSQIWEYVIDVGHRIAEGLRSNASGTDVDRAHTAFLNRARRIVAALGQLCERGLESEAPVLLRALFELRLQYEYLMQEPEARASQFRGYTAVSKGDFVAALEGPESGLFAQELLRMPEISSQIASIRQARKHAKVDYPCDHWYAEKNLRRLAKAVGREDEYVFFYKLGCLFAHSDPWVMVDGFTLSVDGCLPCGIDLYRRVLRIVAEHYRLVLAAEDHEFLFRADGLRLG